MHIQHTKAEVLILTAPFPFADDSLELKLKAIRIDFFLPVPCAAVTIDLTLQDQLTLILEPINLSHYLEKLYVYIA